VYRTIRKCEGKTWDGILASLLRSCTRLATLDLDCGPVSDKGLGAVLRHCASLVELRLRGLNVPIPAEVAIPSLTQLDMRLCIVTDAVMVAISKACTNMRNLYLFAHWDTNRVPSITEKRSSLAALAIAQHKRRVCSQYQSRAAHRAGQARQLYRDALPRLAKHRQSISTGSARS
jgi:hypothetical protein